MSQSWGHAAQRFSPHQLANLGPWSSKCRSGRNCPNPTTHLLSYNYGTGRAGRVSWAQKYACDDHAARYATKHGIQISEPGERPKHALERIIEGGLAR